MTRYKVLGFMISLSLLFGYEPMAEAAPVTVPSSAVISNSDGLVVQAAIAGSARRRAHLVRGQLVLLARGLAISVVAVDSCLQDLRRLENDD